MLRAWSLSPKEDFSLFICSPQGRRLVLTFTELVPHLMCIMSAILLEPQPGVVAVEAKRGSVTTARVVEMRVSRPGVCLTQPLLCIPQAASLAI